MSSGALPNLRRIVTTHNEIGLAVVKSDELVAPQEVGSDGLKVGKIWLLDSVPTTDNNTDVAGGSRPILKDSGFIVPNGTNCSFTDLAPGAITPWHRTSSLDHNILIKGTLILILDDGTEEILDKPGDVVIQRGTMHAWRNPGPEWTRWVAVLVDAEPTVVNGKTLPHEFIKI